MKNGCPLSISCTYDQWQIDEVDMQVSKVELGIDVELGSAEKIQVR